MKVQDPLRAAYLGGLLEGRVRVEAAMKYRCAGNSIRIKRVPEFLTRAKYDEALSYSIAKHGSATLQANFLI